MKFKRKKIEGAVGVLLSLAAALAAQITVVDQGHFRYERPAVEMHRSGGAMALRCENHVTSARAGEADLPSYHVNWAVGTDPVLRITNVEYDTIRTDLPVSRVAPDTTNLPEVTSRAGDVAVAAIVDTFVVRGVRGVTVRITPFQESRSGKIISVKSCGIQVESTPVEPVTIESPTFYNIMQKSFPNADLYINRGSRSEKENYLIIAETGFHDALQPLIEYRSEEYNVTLIDAVTLGGNQMLIISKIKELYADPATRPTYLLLVGGFPYLPMCNPISTSSLGTPLNDLWYGAVDGDDHYADILVGRFSLNSGENEKLTNAIDKTIAYETAKTHPRKNLYIAAGGIYEEHATEPMNYVDSAYFVPYGYSSTRFFESEIDPTPEMVSEEIDAGLDFLFYSGHGNWDHWKTGSYFGKHIKTLINESYPIVFSFACLTGDLSTVLGECFGETWVNEKGGAVAFLGASTETTWEPDDLFQRMVIDGMFDSTIATMQAAVTYGKMALDANFPKYGIFYSETFNLCGDPALKVSIPVDGGSVSIPAKQVLKSEKSVAVHATARGFRISNPSGSSAKVDLYSMNGKRLIHTVVSKGKSEISTAGIAPGIYTLLITPMDPGVKSLTLRTVIK